MHARKLSARWVLLAVWLTAGHASAQDSATLAAPAARATPAAQTAPATLAQQRFPQPVRVADLLNRPILQPLESRPVLGYVDKVIRRADGRLQLIVRYGGFLGFGARLIAVPAESMLLLGPELEIIDLIPTQLGALATFTDVDAVSLAPDAVIRLGIVGPSH